jgi:hypothetical protein
MNKLPVEIVEHMILFVPEYHGILISVCRMWRAIIMAWRKRRNLPLLISTHLRVAGLNAMMEAWSFPFLRKEQQLMAGALNNDVDMLDRVINSHITRLSLSMFDKYVYYVACKYNHEPVIVWAMEKGADPHRFAMIGAIQNGDMNMVRWAKFNGCYLESSLYAVAIRCNNIEMVRYMRTRCVGLDEDGWLALIECDRLDIIQDLINNMNMSPRNIPIELIVKYNRINILKWLHGDLLLPVSTDVGVYASGMGKYDMLKWAIENGMELLYAVYLNVVCNDNMLDIIHTLYHKHPNKYNEEWLAISKDCNSVQSIEWLLRLLNK